MFFLFVFFSFRLLIHPNLLVSYSVILLHLYTHSVDLTDFSKVFLLPVLNWLVKNLYYTNPTWASNRKTRKAEVAEFPQTWQPIPTPTILTIHTRSGLSPTHTHITQTHQPHLSTLAWMIKTMEAAHRSPHQYKLQGSCWLAGTFPLPLGLPWLHVQPLISPSTFWKRTDTSVLLFMTHWPSLWPTQHYMEVPQTWSQCRNKHLMSETNIQVEFHFRQAYRTSGSGRPMCCIFIYLFIYFYRAG